MMILMLAGLQLGRRPAGQETTTSVPTLTVSLVRPQQERMPVRIPASGHVAAWQEAIVGAEADGLRLVEVRVNVGDVVRRGDVLAVFDAGLADAALDEAKAARVQAKAEADEADTNARRAVAVGEVGAMSAQQVAQYVAASVTARARLVAADAVLRRHQLHRAQTVVRAADDGVISARSATVGAVVPAGQELFRLIREGRLEWRARVAVADLARLQPGQDVTLLPDGRPALAGTLRVLAPDIAQRTHSGLVYVDLPAGSDVRAGEFLTGEVQVGQSEALTLPQTAVQLRDGTHHVMRVDAQAMVRSERITVGRRRGGRVEVVAGLAPGTRVIASGLGFLSDGDTVRVVDGTRKAARAATPGAAP